MGETFGLTLDGVGETTPSEHAGVAEPEPRLETEEAPVTVEASVRVVEASSDFLRENLWLLVVCVRF